MISFHEATVTAFHATAGAVHLELVDVTSADGSHAAQIQVAGVTRILVDGESATAVAMEHEDGEVLTLEVSERGARAYRIEGETVTLTLSPPVRRPR